MSKSEVSSRRFRRIFQDSGRDCLVGAESIADVLYTMAVCPSLGARKVSFLEGSSILRHVSHTARILVKRTTRSRPRLSHRGRQLNICHPLAKCARSRVYVNIFRHCGQGVSRSHSRNTSARLLYEQSTSVFNRRVSLTRASKQAMPCTMAWQVGGLAV
jgi:hypothetical protein